MQSWPPLGWGVNTDRCVMSVLGVSVSVCVCVNAKKTQQRGSTWRHSSPSCWEENSSHTSTAKSTSHPILWYRYTHTHTHSAERLEMTLASRPYEKSLSYSAYSTHSYLRYSEFQCVRAGRKRQQAVWHTRHCFSFSPSGRRCVSSHKLWVGNQGCLLNTGNQMI